MKIDTRTLGEIGEFQIINEIILPRLKYTSTSVQIGDDCAFVELDEGANTLVVTSDATPKPLVWNLGHKSFYTWGWYSVLINASDLAAAGAKPIAFTTSVEAPSSMSVSELDDFFCGLRDACTQMGIPNAGGNLREAPRFECHGTAIGTTRGGVRLTRHGCTPGDSIYVIGHLGCFITNFLKGQRLGLHALSAEEMWTLTNPFPHIKIMQLLAEAGVVSAATDNSDGILGALWNIAERSNIGIEVFLDNNVIPENVLKTAEVESIDPWNLFFYWGDWQQVVAVPSKFSARFLQIIKKNRIQHTLIGRSIDSGPVLIGKTFEQRRKLRVLRNENFRSNSYNRSEKSLEDYMLKTSIFDDSLIPF